MATTEPYAPASVTGRVQGTVRRIIVYILLFALVTTAAIGLSGLLARLLGERDVIAGGDPSGLALSLAFTLIAGPLAVLLWVFTWKRLAEPQERSSVAWGLYLAGMSTVALITSSTALLDAAASSLSGDWRGERFATGLVWALVWGWHRWMLRHPLKGPTRLAGVADVIGFAFGLSIAIGAGIAALGGLFDQVILGSSAMTVGDPWWRPVLQSAIWAAGGVVIWWWHWRRAGAERLRTTFSDVAVIALGVLVAGVLALGGAALVLFVLLRLAFDHTDPLRVLLEPLGPAIAAVLIGALLWVYHQAALASRSSAARHTAALIASGVALAFAASGIGVVVNATLGALTPVLAGSDTRTLLLGGISSLVVGAPTWWFFWRGADPATPGRRVYLIVIFGISAVVALIALLVIGFRIFEFFFDSAVPANLLDRIRAPFGLLLATGLVAGHHFTVWRRTRPAVSEEIPVSRAIGHVTLVTAGASRGEVEAIRAATGAGVTVWNRLDSPEPGILADATQLVAALEGVVGEHVLVVVGADASIEVIPVATRVRSDER
ncbi:DUF5671 domain-containing protein [Ruicaihuangia caeni]|uniref:DUF5671 domain-containing protein n=1 Tax=Ruicaihuangia caeni TaxID=3042517 RepID=UPI00338FE5F5